MATPGLLFVNTTPDADKGLSAEAFNDWYNNKHIPELLRVPGLTTAIRYENVDSEGTPKYLCLYPLANLATLATPELQAVSNVDEKTFPGPSHDLKDSGDLKARVYAHIQTYEPEKKSGPANLLLAVSMTPAEGTDEDFDKWYREEHLADLAKCTSYVRSRRFKTVRPHSDSEAPDYIAFHEFEGETLPMEELTKTTQTEWGKKSMSNALKTEMVVWKLLKAFGDADLEF